MTFDVRDAAQLDALEALAKAVRPGLLWAHSVRDVLPALLVRAREANNLEERVKELERQLKSSNDIREAEKKILIQEVAERDAFAKRCMAKTAQRISNDYDRAREAGESGNEAIGYAFQQDFTAILAAVKAEGPNPEPAERVRAEIAAVKAEGPNPEPAERVREEIAKENPDAK